MLFIVDVLQELWKMVVHSLEKIVVLPPLTDPRAVCLPPRMQEFTNKHSMIIVEFTTNP